MKYVAIIALAAMFAVPAAAQITCCYSWEDGATVLGTYGNVTDVQNVTGPQVGSQGSTLPDYTCPGAFDGDRYLHMAEDPHYGTPDVIIAWVTGLVDGDEVTASYYGYDITEGTSPSHRIWGAYTDGLDPNNYISSAGGPTDYTAGLGWDATSHTWVYAGGEGNGLQIQARMYSTPSTSDPDHTDYFIDYVCVTVPTNACVHFPQPVSPVENSSWTSIKALYR